MTPEMRKKLEQFLFGLRPRGEWLVPPGLRLPWDLIRPKDLYEDKFSNQYRSRMGMPTSRSSENQSYWRNRRLINSGKIPAKSYLV